VTKDIPNGALAISRMKQKNIRGWSKKVSLRRQAVEKVKSKKG
jgi:bifunctional N-acetylglucosamine-1-phosphate-uridyltransferase/glucosamine-1-phosphate-acetyltransferase GlmU-like protein